MRRAAWIGIVAVAGAAAWLALRPRGSGPREEPASSATERGEPAAGDEGSGEPVPSRVSARPEPEAPTPPSPEPSDPRSALARELDLVAESFLGEDPRLADLLRLVQELAQRSAVEPESVAVERDEEGALRFARGALVADLDGSELRGTFLIEEGTYHVTFAGAVAGAPWYQRDLLLTFGDGGAHAERCRAVVQFQPRPADAGAATEVERIVGWSLAIAPETGAEMRPMTAAPDGDGWRIGAARESELRELPWISNTACFDAWLARLHPVLD